MVRTMSSAMLSQYTEQLGPEWANTCLIRGTFVPEDIFSSLAAHVPHYLQVRFIRADEDERITLLFEDISDHLNTIAPPGCYFGSHPGSHSDLGFWDECTDQDKPLAHKVTVNDKVTYRIFNDVTDTYSETILTGDLRLYCVTEELRINRREVSEALCAIKNEHHREIITDYISYLERCNRS